MQEKTIKINLKQRSAHVLYMGIIEHSFNPYFKKRLSEEEYETLENLRNTLKAPYPEEIYVSSQDLFVLVKAFEIGLNDLDPIEFPIIVGEPYEYGKAVLSKINTFITSDLGGLLELE